VRVVWAIVHVLGSVNAVGPCEIEGLSILCLGCSGVWKWRGDDEGRLLMELVLRVEGQTSRDSVSSEVFGIGIREVDSSRNIRSALEDVGLQLQTMTCTPSFHDAQSMPLICICRITSLRAIFRLWTKYMVTKRY